MAVPQQLAVGVGVREVVFLGDERGVWRWCELGVGGEAAVFGVGSEGKKLGVLLGVLEVEFWEWQVAHNFGMFLLQSQRFQQAPIQFLQIPIQQPTSPAPYIC